MPDAIILILSLSKDATVELPRQMRLPSLTGEGRGEGPGSIFSLATP